MNTETPAFEPTEEQVRHHNSILLTPEYLALEESLQKLIKYARWESLAWPDSQICRPWVCTGKRGPVVIEQENAHEANHGTDPVT